MFQLVTSGGGGRVLLHAQVFQLRVRKFPVACGVPSGGWQVWLAKPGNEWPVLEVASEAVGVAKEHFDRTLGQYF